jgi:hypothetical protein
MTEPGFGCLELRHMCRLFGLLHEAAAEPGPGPAVVVVVVVEAWQLDWGLEVTLSCRCMRCRE